MKPEELPVTPPDRDLDRYPFGTRLTAGFTLFMIGANAVAPTVDEPQRIHFYKHDEIEINRPSTGEPRGKVSVIAHVSSTASASSTIVRLPFPPSI